MSFIKTMFMKEVDRMKDIRGPQARIQNIAWPSESMVQLGPISVGECKRAMFYKILGVQPTDPMSVTGQTICDVALLYEDYHIKKYKAAGMHVEDQMRIEYIMPNTVNKVIVSGKGDEVISYQGKLRLIEMKSISAWKAAKITGGPNVTPLPAANNLMQAMLYKYYTKYVDNGISKNIDEVYLQYINRSDGSLFFYKVDINDNGFPIITAINCADKELYSIDLETCQSFDDLLSSSNTVTSEQSRLAEIRININDIFSKFDNVYTNARNKILPAKDYSLVYTQEELNMQHKLGMISTTKYNKQIKGTEVYGDDKCLYCSFQKQCIKDCGKSLN